MSNETVPDNVVVGVVLISIICALTVMTSRGCAYWELRQKSIDVREKYMIDQGYTYEYNDVNGNQRWYKSDGTGTRAEYTP